MRHGVPLGVALLYLGVAALVVIGGVSAATTVSNESNESVTAPNVSMSVTDNASFDSADDVEAALANGTLESDEYLMAGQTLVISVESDRLTSDMSDRDGTPTDRFFAVLEDGVTFRLLQTNPSPQRTPLQIPLAPENTTVFRSESTVYVSIDTEKISPTWVEDALPEDGIPLDAGQQYALQFGYDLDHEYETVGPEIEFQFVEAELFGPYSTSPPPVLAPENTELSVKINVEPEEKLLVRMELADGTTITKEPGAVPWSGFPGLKVDLRDVESGTNYTLELVHDGTVVFQQNGTVTEPDASLRNPDLTVHDDGTVRLNLTATLSHGGQLQVVDAWGTSVGFKWVSPGTTNVSIALAQSDEFPPDELEIRAVRRFGSKIDPYPGDKAQFTMDVREFNWPAENGTQTATDTPQSTPTATDTPIRTGGPSESTDSPTTTPDDTTGPTETTDSQGPGFTVGITLLAMLALLATGVRRCR